MGPIPCLEEITASKEGLPNGGFPKLGVPLKELYRGSIEIYRV